MNAAAASRPPLRVVLNADDFGRDADTVEATISAFERGLLSSATIMANMPAAAEAIAWARENPQFSFGVHLVWVSDGLEYPLSPVEEIPSLVGPDGQFRGSTTMRLLGMLHRVPPREIAAEAERQILRVREAGVPVSHVDGHGHVHKFGSFRTALRRVLPRLGIERVRTAQDVYLAPSRRSPTVWLGAHWRRELARSFRSTDHFYMPASDGPADWDAELLPRLRHLGGVVEIGVHPGTAENWRRDEFDRLARFAPRLREAGVPLVGWSEV